MEKPAWLSLISASSPSGAELSLPHRHQPVKLLTSNIPTERQEMTMGTLYRLLQSDHIFLNICLSVGWSLQYKYLMYIIQPARRCWRQSALCLHSYKCLQMLSVCSIIEKNTQYTITKQTFPRISRIICKKKERRLSLNC